MQRFRLIRRYLAASALVATAFAGAEAGAQGPSPVWLRVMAFADQPLANADVAVYDVYGHLIADESDATNDAGFFPLKIAGLPQQFRVVVRAEGGAYTLSADFDNFDPAAAVVYVDPVTTLVSDIQENSPWATLEAARTRTRKYLRLHAHEDLGLALEQDSAYENPAFSEAAFMAAAKRSGGVDALLNDMAAQAIHDRDATRSFADPNARLNPIAAGVLRFIGSSIAQSALYYSAGEGVGWVLEASGIVQSNTTAADIRKLQQSMKDLQVSVDALNQKFEALSREVNKKFTEQQISRLRNVAANQRELIEPLQEALVAFSQGCPPLPDDGTVPAHRFADFCEDQLEKLPAALGTPKVQGAFDRIAGVLLEQKGPSDAGLLHLYSEYLGTTRPTPFFKESDAQLMQSTADDWWGVELEAADLYVERLHFIHAQTNAGGRKQLLDFLGRGEDAPGDLQNTLAAENSLLWPLVPAGTVVLSADRTVWLQDWPAIRAVPPFPIGSNCSSPNPQNPQPNAPITTPVMVDGISYMNPTRTEVSTMYNQLLAIRGAQYPLQLWDAMASVGGFAPPPHGECQDPYNTYIAWTRDSAGDGKYWTWLAGTYFRDPGVYFKSVATGNREWSFYVHEPKQCEQFYWYSGQQPGTCGK